MQGMNAPKKEAPESSHLLSLEDPVRKWLLQPRGGFSPETDTAGTPVSAFLASGIQK